MHQMILSRFGQLMLIVQLEDWMGKKIKKLKNCLYMNVIYQNQENQNQENQENQNQENQENQNQENQNQENQENQENKKKYFILKYKL